MVSYFLIGWISLDHKQSVFFLGPSSKKRVTRKWPRAWLLDARARALPSRNLNKKKDCSHSRISSHGSSVTHQSFPAALFVSDYNRTCRPLKWIKTKWKLIVTVVININVDRSVCVWSEMIQSTKDTVKWNLNKFNWANIWRQGWTRSEEQFCVVYSYFKKSHCRKKCTRQSRKVLWMVFSSLFFKQIWKNGTRGHGHMFASAKGKQQKWVRQLHC